LRVAFRLALRQTKGLDRLHFRATDPCNTMGRKPINVSLTRLAVTDLTPMTTLYVPPKQDRPIDREVA
jgi:hypothetical protein